MITYKTAEEIAIMSRAGDMVKKTMKQLVPLIVPGVTTQFLDTKAEQFIQAQGGESSFKKVEGYRWTICAPVNEQVVHTPPNNKPLKKGDLLTIDIGAYLQGFHTDHAITVVVGGGATPQQKRFLEVGQQSLAAAITAAKLGNRIGHISQAMGSVVYDAGYVIMKQLTGHGVGHELHEDPFIPGFLDRPVEKTMKLRAGMTLALEVIYSMGKSAEIAYDDGDEWSIVPSDRALSACFEHTIAITDKNTLVLT